MPNLLKMNDSILDTIKKLIGFEPEYTAFDIDIIIAINAAIGVLTQIGIGPDEGYSIQNNTNTWSELVTDVTKLDLVKQYIYLRVKTVFDPSASSSVSTAYQNLINELEWRLNIEHETENS